MTPSPLGRPRRLEDISRRELPDGNIAVLVLARSTALMLNPMAGAVLDLCDGTRTIEEIAEFICEQLPDARLDVVVRDVRVVVERLREDGCLAPEA